jgi:23S rRNA pseudouridine1911/1915/1917 synthase
VVVEAGALSEEIRVVVHEGEPERLDRALARALPDLSRNRLQDLIRDGRVEIGGRAAANTSAKVAPGVEIRVIVPEATPPEPLGEAIPLVVVFEDEDVIVIDKPAGLVVHPAAGHETGTLVNALIAHCGASLSGIGGVRRPGIVHRLDKDTSGLLVVAKNDAAHGNLSAQFADHGRTGPLRREYIALVWGEPERARETIQTGIDRSNQNREKMAVVAEGRGREAITHVSVEERFGLASAVRCRLETGRTHQIRVHMAHRGHPLMGDETYGSGFKTKANRLPNSPRAALDALGRQALHAAVLGFAHPRTDEFMGFESPLPSDMALLRDALRAMGQQHP